MRFSVISSFIHPCWRGSHSLIWALCALVQIWVTRWQGWLWRFSAWGQTCREVGWHYQRILVARDFASLFSVILVEQKFALSTVHILTLSPHPIQETCVHVQWLPNWDGCNLSCPKLCKCIHELIVLLHQLIWSWFPFSEIKLDVYIYIVSSYFNNQWKCYL